ncbi:unnamed protein product, partial [marine sediment metagenome]
SDKKQTQQCFLQTFNDLYNNNRQIIITADRPPKDMALLSKRIAEETVEAKWDGKDTNFRLSDGLVFSLGRF